jgi:hypothetical protein
MESNENVFYVHIPSILNGALVDGGSGWPFFLPTTFRFSKLIGGSNNVEIPKLSPH